jgi:two-component system NtrC family sensor kinase
VPTVTLCPVAARFGCEMIPGSRLKTFLVLISAAAALYLGIVNLMDRAAWRQPWDGMVWGETDSGLVARRVADPSAAGPAAGLAAGDRLLDISGVEIRDLDDYTEALEMLLETLPEGTPVAYLVRKTSTDVEVEYAFPLDERWLLGSTDLFLSLVALIHLFIGLLIFLRAWKAEGVLHFYLICLISFVLYLYRYSGRADSFDLLIYWVSAVALLLLPPLFLHFCCFFPEPVPFVRGVARLKGILYAPFLVLLTLHSAWFSGLLQPLGLPRNPEIAQFLDSLHLAHFAAFFGLGVWALAFNQRRAASPLRQQQMKWVLYGTVAALLPFTCFYVVPYFLGLPILKLMEASILGLALIPLCFGYAIIRYRLMDVEQIFRESAAYVLASWILLVLYVGMVLLIGRALQGLSSGSGFELFSVSALVVAFLFAPIKNWIQERLDRYFYKDAYDYRGSFAEFAKTLSSEISLSRLAERITDRVLQTLRVSPVALFLRSGAEADLYQLYHSSNLGDSSDLPRYLEVPQNVFADFDRQLNPVFLSPPDEKVSSLRLKLAEWGLYYVQPLLLRGRVIGFLGLGRRGKRGLLSSEDLDLVAILSGYAAIALDNAGLYRSLEAKASELQRLKGYSENVIESILAGVVVVDSDGRITVWNSSMESLYGLSSAAAVGKNLEDIFPADLLQTIRELLEGDRWLAKETGRLRKTYLESREGENRLVDITLSPLVVHDDVVTGTLLVFNDVTEKVRLENQLLQAEKLTSIGLLAAGVAHEVNTPLAGISGYTQLLLGRTPPEDPRHDDLKQIERQAVRASTIVNNLVNFARVSDGDLTDVSLNSVMLETLELLHHQMHQNRVEVQLDLDPVLPSTRGNGGRLQQVFVNLLLNARDAMLKGGHIDVKTFQEDSQLVVEVKDSGRGIPRANIKQIYDPFFTTKEVGKGTGLGLSVSYGIIQEHSGRINVKSHVGEGTTFTLHFPIKRVH